MTEKEMAVMWKTEIERGLQSVQELREKLNPVEFTSELWNQYRGAYGDVREDVAFLFCPPNLMPDTEKIRRLDDEEKENDEINFDNLSENLMHQMSLYDASYLAMPYLVLFLEKKRQVNDFDWQLKIISLAGDILMTDIPYFGGGSEANIPKDIMESYNRSVDILKEMTKDFLNQNTDKLKEQDSRLLKYFCTEVLAILGDREAAYALLVGGWEVCCRRCPNCGSYDEIMESDEFHLYDMQTEPDEFPDKEEIRKIREEIGEIKPAPSVIGKWDGRSYEDTYLWFSNLTHILGMKDAWKVPYYYGTYTCPSCKSKGILIEWMKEK